MLFRVLVEDEISECPDFAVCLLHVACMLVYDRVESTVIDRAQDIIMICDIDDG